VCGLVNYLNIYTYTNREECPDGGERVTGTVSAKKDDNLILTPQEET